ncbi:MAG: quinone oxidoreductase [Myxococcales bacterium]|nr:quinone oxidoreductase [Myxococcales bacterium]MCB9576815.1 quinone oxidoreductase [Polyangiaceae bacterium]
MPNAILVHETGGPEKLRYEPVEVGEPGPGQARVRHTAIGINYIDTYHRSGLYALPSLPHGIGMEAAGVVEAVGSGVADLRAGQRVAYGSGAPGAYAEARVMAADRLVPLPDDIDDVTAAAMMLKGMTAEYLIQRCFPVKRGQTVLWHAAAGGVGLIACQWLSSLGVTVIGTVGSDEKAELARAHGATHTIVYTKEEFPARVRELTGGRGVPVVFDSVGRSTFAGSLDCLEPLGMMVGFGNASGKPDPFDMGILAQKGSLYLTRPTLMTYTAKREDLLASANALFDVVRRGVVRIEVNQRWPLAEAEKAHRALEARETTGSSVLVV